MDLANCLTSSSIGCLLCCYYHGNLDRLRRDFVFMPPLVSYQVEDAVLASHPSKRWGKLTYTSEVYESSPLFKKARECSKVKMLKTTNEERIPLVWIRDPSLPEGKPALVILHCHGNATDIGQMMSTYYQLSTTLGVEVAGLEYTGYGCSSGSPSVHDCHADIEAAYEFLLTQGVLPENIIAYGQSLGSGPAVGLASKRKIGGVILHSPMLSGIQVIDPQPHKNCKPSSMCRCFDFFLNEKAIRTLTCPAFVIHGLKDDTTPPSHGQTLHALTPEAYRWPMFTPTTAAHNDIIEKEGAKYFQEVASFLEAVRSANNPKVEKPLTGEEGEVPEESDLQPAPIQVNMDAMPREVSPTDPSEILLVYKEPVVGPINGMYASWRRHSPPQPSLAEFKNVEGSS